MRFFAVYGLFVLLMIVDVSSFGSKMIQEMRPPLVFLALFYWSVYRPTLVPLWAAFLMGLFIDLYSGFLGLNALGFTLLRFFIVSQRRLFVGQPFIHMLLGVSVAAFFFYAMQWAVLTGIQGEYIPPMELFLKIVSSIVTFPLFVLLMRIAHRIIPSHGPVAVKQVLKPKFRR